MNPLLNSCLLNAIIFYRHVQNLRFTYYTQNFNNGRPPATERWSFRPKIGQRRSCTKLRRINGGWQKKHEKPAMTWIELIQISTNSPDSMETNTYDRSVAVTNKPGDCNNNVRDTRLSARIRPPALSYRARSHAGFSFPVITWNSFQN